MTEKPDSAPPSSLDPTLDDDSTAPDPSQIRFPPTAGVNNPTVQRLYNLPSQSNGRLTSPKLPIAEPQVSLITLTAIVVMIVGLAINNFWLGISGAIVAGLISVRVLWLGLVPTLSELVPPKQRSLTVAVLGTLAAFIGLLNYVGFTRLLQQWFNQLEWDAIGSLAEWTGAVGQIFIAVLAVYVAWRQYVISRDLTIQQNALTVQQNIITQQQTIDAYFQGISDLVLDEEGLLEDWPQERLLAEGRTAAILSSVDASGKAKILRFLSSSKLLTPLERDSRLGRAIFNGVGGYAEDRANGVRVIDLGVMLAKADLSNTDLRRTDLSEANLVSANLMGCDLVKANLSRTILYEATLVGAELKAARLFYGSVETATPRSHTQPPHPNYKTGAYTGAVIENADFTGVKGLSEDQRQYCCAWGGEKTRATIPGGCEGIPNKLGR